MVSITSDVIPWLVKGTPGYSLFSDPPTQPPLPKYVLAGAETEETTPQRKIISRGTEVFVAAGCEIRCVDLRDLKARYDEGKEGGVKSDKSGTKSEKGYQVGGSGQIITEMFSLNCDIGIGYPSTGFCHTSARGQSGRKLFGYCGGKKSCYLHAARTWLRKTQCGEATCKVSSH